MKTAEEMREYKRLWARRKYAEDPEGRREIRKRYYQRHPQREKAYQAQYRADHPEYVERSTERLKQDHMIPLSKDGLHHISNIVPACSPCNSRKGTKLLTTREFSQLKKVA